MTATQRRVRAAPGPDERAPTEPGVKYTCDSCGIDITHTVRIKCAEQECEEVDLCPTCFSEGKEMQRHRAWHSYKVIEQHSYPIFTSDWGADEELLLVSGLILHGLGNWTEVAEHVGTRTKEECEKHYLEVYLGVGDGPEARTEAETDGDKHNIFMPPMDRDFDVDPDDFQAKKKARIEEMRKPHALPPTGTIAPLVSAPTNHEVGGFMPGRLEFENEVENDAELAVKDMDFGLVFKYGGDEQPQAKVTRPPEEEGDDEDDEDEDDEEDSKPLKRSGVKVEPGEEGGSKKKRKREAETAPVDPPVEVEDEDELEIKLAMLDIYFSKLDKRETAKELIFDRALTEHKRIQANERKRPKEERELIQRFKVFAKLQTAQDFEVLIEGLIFEQQLRRRITELQEYRRVGVTTAAEAEHYETAKAARAGYRPAPSREQSEIIRSGARINAGQNRFLHGTPPPGAAAARDDSRGVSRDPAPRVPGHGGRKPPAPLNLANAAALDLLSSEEQHLCSTLRVMPKPYLLIKETYLRENERRKGLLKRRDARKMMKIDVNKSGRIFDFLVANGILKLMYDPTVKGLGPGKEGHHIGTPIDVVTGRPAFPPPVPQMPIANGA